MYDPIIGRFISADSVDQDWYDPQKLNRYAYVRNNPLKYIDPTGHYDDKDNHDLGSGGYQSEGDKQWTRGAGGKELAGRRERQTQFEKHLKRVDKVVPYMLGAGALKGGKLLLGASKLVKSEASPLASKKGAFPKNPKQMSKELGVDPKAIKSGQRWKPSDKVKIEHHEPGVHSGEPSKPGHYHVSTKQKPPGGKTRWVRSRKPDGSADYHPGDSFPGN